MLDRLFANDPNVPDDQERTVHLWVAGIMLAALAFLVALKRGLKTAAV